MRLTFRQGIISAPANFLHVHATGVGIRLPLNGKVVATISDSLSSRNEPTNYLITEHDAMVTAWRGPFAAGIDYWLYWDIDVSTGERTFGSTTVEPLMQLNRPTNPLDGQIWFDLAANNTKVWNEFQQKWIRRIRVFACKLSNGSVPISMSINSTRPTDDFIGTQVGDLDPIGAVAGSLLYDTFGSALKKSDGTFFTTEDHVMATVSDSTQVKFESLLLPGKAAEPIAAYSFVHFSDYGVIRPATNINTTRTAFGVILEDVMTSSTTDVVTSGVVTNSQWDFEALGWDVNTALYINGLGNLTNLPQAIPAKIGIVVDQNTILIQQSLGDFKLIGGEGGGGASALSDLVDVDVTGATTGQALTFDAVTSRWIPVTPNSTIELGGLSNVTITAPTDRNVLSYDAFTSKWINTPEPEVVVPDVVEGSHLIVNKYVVAAAGTFKLGEVCAIDTTNGNIVRGLANNTLDDAEIVGIVIALDAATNTIEIASMGVYEQADWSDVVVAGTQMTAGTKLYLSDDEPGKMTSTVVDAEYSYIAPIGMWLGNNKILIKLETPIGL